METIKNPELDLQLPPALPVISASRRTDLARCFPEVLSGWLAAGTVSVRNPFNGRERQVDLRPESVHTLVLWSKDYSRLLADEFQLRTRLRAYSQIYFHLTITGLGGGPLESGIAPAQQVSRQFAALAELAGDARRVNWRFDPIVFWRAGRGVTSNLMHFDALAAEAALAGLTQVTVSLCQWYPKVRRRAQKQNWRWVQPKPGRMRALSRWLQDHASRQGLQVRTCCCSELGDGLQPAHCIDGELLTQLHPSGSPAARGKDSGQRLACGCTPSVDIGDYHLSCPDGCVYCYANPIERSQ